MPTKVFKFIALFIAFLFVFYFLKKIQTKPSAISTENIELNDIYESELPTDFATFYNDFHTDSIFQKSRIIFPIEGLKQSSDSIKVTEHVLWTEKDWKIHTPFDNHDGTFERTFTNLGGIITEKISASEGLFTIEKRYAKLDGTWHLIYYQDLIMQG